MKLFFVTQLILLLFLGVGCVSSTEQNDDPYAGLTPVPDSELHNLYFHQTYFASSEDGVDWEVSSTPIAKHASVPDLILLEQDLGDFRAGTLMSYFVDSSPMRYGLKERVSFISSTDNGKTWSERTNIQLDQSDHLPVDPSIVQLEDGRMRLYYFDFSIMQDPGMPSEKTATFYSAISHDGINFTLEGIALQLDRLMTDPEVVQTDDGWIMYYARAREDEAGIWIATSQDGRSFSHDSKVEVFEGIPGAMATEQGIHLFGCEVNQGIVSAISNNGIDFPDEYIQLKNPFRNHLGGVRPDGSPEQPPENFYNLRGCDPSPSLLSDGAYGLVLKEIVEE